MLLSVKLALLRIGRWDEQILNRPQLNLQQIIDNVAAHALTEKNLIYGLYRLIKYLRFVSNIRRDFVSTGGLLLMW